MYALSIFLYERLVTNMPSFNFNNSARELQQTAQPRFKRHGVWRFLLKIKTNKRFA